MAIYQKPEMIEAVSKKLGSTKKEAEAAVGAVIDVLSEQLLKGNTIKFTKFGYFGVVARNARKGRNPKTGEIIDIPATLIPAFKPSKLFKVAVNESKVAQKAAAKAAKVAK